MAVLFVSVVVTLVLPFPLWSFFPIFFGYLLLAKLFTGKSVADILGPVYCYIFYPWYRRATKLCNRANSGRASSQEEAELSKFHNTGVVSYNVGIVKYEKGGKIRLGTRRFWFVRPDGHIPYEYHI